MTGEIFRKFLTADIRLLLDITQDVHAAESLGDRRFVRCGLSLLGDAISDGTNLIRTFYKGQAKIKLGASEDRGKHWQKGSPIEILENMRLVQSYYITIVRSLEETAGEMEEREARVFDRKRIQNLREMALRIQTGKMAIMAKDLSFWNPELEEEFKEALKYRLVQ